MQRLAKIEEAFDRKYPEQVVLVTSCSPEGKANVMAVGWTMIASSAPWMFALGIDESAYSYSLIRATREFVVAYPAGDMAEAVLFAGTHSGRETDKFAATGLAVQKASKVRAPLLADAVANFECHLTAEYRPGDCPILIGEVIAAHINVEPSRRRLYTVAKGYKLSEVRECPAQR